MIDLNLNETLADGSLRYSLNRETHIQRNIVSIKLTITNVSSDDIIPAKAWESRLDKARLTDASGRTYVPAGWTALDPTLPFEILKHLRLVAIHHVGQEASKIIGHG